MRRRDDDSERIEREEHKPQKKSPAGWGGAESEEASSGIQEQVLTESPCGGSVAASPQAASSCFCVRPLARRRSVPLKLVMVSTAPAKSASSSFAWARFAPERSALRNET